MMTEHERMNYWWRRAKKAEAEKDQAWIDGAKYAFEEVSGDGWNGECFPDAAKPINWTDHHRIWKAKNND